MSYQIGDLVQIRNRNHRCYNEVGKVIELNTLGTKGLLRLMLVNTGSAQYTRVLESDVVAATRVHSTQQLTQIAVRPLYQTGDVVEHCIFNCEGTVYRDEQPGDLYLFVETTDPNSGKPINVQWKQANVSKVTKASSGAPAPAPKVLAGSGVAASQSTGLDVGDYVKYIGSDPQFKGLRGTITQIFRSVTATGSHLVAEVQLANGDLEEIEVSSLVVCSVPVGHYQAVSQEEDSNFEPGKKPFDHDQLGTDLSGDELMKSIRDFCEGNY